MEGERHLLLEDAQLVDPALGGRSGRGPRRLLPVGRGEALDIAPGTERSALSGDHKASDRGIRRDDRERSGEPVVDLLMERIAALGAVEAEHGGAVLDVAEKVVSAGHQCARCHVRNLRGEKDGVASVGPVRSTFQGGFQRRWTSSRQRASAILTSAVS